MMAENINFNVVVDASFILAYLMPDELDLLVDKVLQNQRKNFLFLYSTHLIDYEILNSLKTAILRKRITIEECKLLTSAYEKIIIEKVFINNQCIELAQRYKLSVYDASFLQLAIDRELPLLTKDNKLNQITKQLLPKFSIKDIETKFSKLHDRDGIQYTA